MDKSILDLWYYQEVLSNSNIQVGDKLIFCDIDGTIFRDSLYIEIFLGLIYDGLSSTDSFRRQLAKNSMEIHEDALQKWKNREWAYDKYLHTTIECFTDLVTWMYLYTFNTICEKIVQEKSKRTYVYPLSFLKAKQKEWYKIILISGSPDYVVNNFAMNHKFEVGMWSYYFTSQEQFISTWNGLGYYDQLLTWDKFLLAMSKSKEDIVNYIFNTYKPSHTISLWDTNGDYKMLTMTDQGMAINPSFELFDKVKELDNITVIIERKDLVIELDKKDRENMYYFNNMWRIFD